MDVKNKDKMGEKGWTMPTVSKEYGGGGLSNMARGCKSRIRFMIGLALRSRKSKSEEKFP